MERKKLIEYLPPFMRDFAEIKEIMNVEDAELDILNKKMWSVLDNCFIEDCDEYGIKKYENILGIIPLAEDTLESRKIRVLNRWNDTIPYTYKVLIRKLNIFCGVNNYEITGNLKDYELVITTSLSYIGQANELDIMLDKVVPVNMNITSNNNLTREINGTAFMIAATIQKNTFTITTETQKSVSLDGVITGVSSVVTHIHRTIN